MSFVAGVVMAARWQLVGYLAIQGLVASGSYALPGSAGVPERLAVAAVGLLVLSGRSFGGGQLGVEAGD